MIVKRLWIWIILNFDLFVMFQIKDENHSKKTSSTGSQTDLTTDTPLDKRELKMEYKESMKEVQRLHGEIDRVEDQLKNSPTDNGTNNANLTTLLIEEKEALLDEIRRLGSMVKSEEEKVGENMRKNRNRAGIILNRKIAWERFSYDFGNLCAVGVYSLDHDIL